MEGNFIYQNPTKLYFGKDSLEVGLRAELKNYGPKVMLVYGGGSIKRNGIYDRVSNLLKEQGKTVVEEAGVMPNPTLEKLLEGAELARKEQVDLILAVGGGSTIDYSKGVSVAAYSDCDIWETYYKQQQNPVEGQKIIPVASVLTMVGTGSEMNGGSVITNHKENMKIGKVFDTRVYPKFSILNPEFTMTVPQYQMVAGFFDIMSHIMEQYFSGEDDNVSDYLSEGLMRSLITSSLKAVNNPRDYEARSNIMWTATWALNKLIAMGKSEDWEVHMIGQAVGAITNATHGMTLSAVSLAYYRAVMPYGLKKFSRFATNVWNINPQGKTDEQLAEAGLQALSDWMDKIGVEKHLANLGVTEDKIDAICDATIILNSGYKTLTRKEVKEILKESL
ncbi:MAG: iron-containing alcohol dehydrogenase [Prevotella sp.]|jgi:alcohol dehydrogenase YqhD (iron-dependent ADH family)